MRCYKKWLGIAILSFAATSINAQQTALKSNLLFDAGATPNVGLEIGVGKKHSMQVFYGLHPWTFGSGSDKKYLKHWVVNPEWRHWFCHRFNGSFVGIHAFGGEFNASNVKMPLGWWKELQDHRFEGWFVGGGVSYGYQWILSKHWNFEAAAGFGAAYIDYGKFKCGECGKKLEDGNKLYIGPTKAALSLLYLF
jgi:hypothetical protein